MKRSTDRILTTHAGALARPADLREMLSAKDAGRPIDQSEFTRRARGAVAEAVGRQIDSGMDILNDGELAKSNFTNYARERLTGHLQHDSGLYRICPEMASVSFDLVLESWPPGGAIVRLPGPARCRRSR